MEAMRQHFRPEFLNRIDKIIVFHPLGMQQLQKITQLQISYLQDRLLQQNVQLKVTPALVKFISDQSFDPAQGARFVRRNIQQLLEDPLAEKIIAGNTKEGARILIGSDMPEGKGVSSSAALEVSVMMAVAAAYGIEMSPQEMAFLCQRVENLVVVAVHGDHNDPNFRHLAL